LGLCFKCREKYHQGHRCKAQALHVFDGDQLSDIDSDSEDLNSGSVPGAIDPDLATITLCASYTNSHHKPIKFNRCYIGCFFDDNDR
jgi:hypothetical protein